MNEKKFTGRQQVFVDALAATGDKTYALRKAGYSGHVQAADRLLRDPAVAAAIRHRENERLHTECLPAAVDLLRKAVTDDSFPANSRVTAAKIILDRTLGAQDAAAAKEPHEMTAEELQRAIEQLEREAGNRAKVINPDASEPDVFE